MYVRQVETPFFSYKLDSAFLKLDLNFQGNAESAEQPFESEIQTKDLDESAVSETKQESSILESSVANETADEATEPEVEVKAELQQEEKVSLKLGFIVKIRTWCAL